MSNYLVRETANLFDPATGAWLGVKDANGNEQLVPSVAGMAALPTDLGAPFQSLVSGAASLAQRLRRISRIAEQAGCPARREALAAMGGWAATTAYSKGQVISNVGYHYMCRIAGTTGATGPSGQGPAPIVDGTVTWEYLDLQTPATNSQRVPNISVTSTLNAALTKHYNLPTHLDKFHVTGGVPTAASNGYFNNAAYYAALAVTGSNIRQGNLTLHGNCNSYRVRFWTDAALLQPQFSGSMAPVRVIIDGNYTKATSYVPGGPAEPQFITIDRTLTGKRPMLVEMEIFGGTPAPGNSYQGMYFGGVRVSKKDRVWAPSKTDSVTAYFFGSSIEAGGPGGYPTLPATMWPELFGQYVGIDNVVNGADPGCGYLTNNGGAGLKYIERVPDCTNTNPDVVFFPASPNDNGQTAAAITAAVLLLMQTVRAALGPNPVFIACGTYPGSTGPSAAYTNNENAVLAAVTQFADANTYWIPWCTDAGGPWFDGTGRRDSQNATGNSDQYTNTDNVHQSDAANPVIAAMMAEKYRAIVVNSLK